MRPPPPFAGHPIQGSVESVMDENRIEGVAQQGAGHIEDAWGGLSGDAGAQTDGKMRQVRGKAQELYGQAKDTVRDALDARSDQARQRLNDTVDLIGRNPIAAVGVATFVGLTLGLLANAGRPARVVYVKR
jgi:uncharacterized protein YjbJ (UPF0337 family)